MKGQSKSDSLSVGKSRFFLVLSIIIIFFSGFALSGCSGGGGGGSDTTAATDTGSSGGSSGGSSNDSSGGSSGGSTSGDYRGTASIEGTIDLSSLSSQDSQTLESSSTTSGLNRSPLAIDTTKEGVKLYVVDANGDLKVLTDITCTLSEDTDGNPKFTCDGVKDGVNYIVRYVKLAGNGKALELKDNVFIPEGEKAPKAPPKVSPQTTVIVEALVTAVLQATEGVDLTDDVVNNIIDGVKTTVETLVATGAIQIPPMVVDVGTDKADVDSVLGEETKNDKLESVSGQILADEKVDGQLAVITTTTKSKQYDMSVVTTDAQKKEFIRIVFKELLKNDKGGEDHMPDFFYDFFSWLYINNKTYPMGDLLDTLIANLKWDPAFEGKLQGKDLVTRDKIIEAMNDTLNNIYDLQAKTDKTEEEKKKFAEISPVVMGLFPKTSLPLQSATDLNVPQGVAVVIYATEDYIPSNVKLSDSQLSGEKGEDGSISYEDMRFVEIDDESLFKYMGVESYVAANPSVLKGVDIFNLYLWPGSIWLEGENGEPGKEVDALMGGVDFVDASSIMEQKGGELDDTSGAKVVLTYPKLSGGTGEIELKYIKDSGNHGYWGVDPWMEATAGNPPQEGQPVQIDKTRVVSDFTSGTYTVKITYNGETYTKEFTKKVITGMKNKYVKIITPAGMPIWPGNNASTAEMEAFNQAQEEFQKKGGRTNFTANVDDNGNEATGSSATKAKITVVWEAPDVTLPEGVKMAYDLDIGQGGCDENGCTWDPIWNSWEANKRIYATSFTIPHLFEIQSAEDAQAKPYHLNIGVYFVDKKTGEQLGTGGRAHAEFTVGEPLDLTKTFTIRGLNAIKIDDTNVDASKLKIALVKETQVNNKPQQTIVKLNDISGTTAYSLEPKISDFINDQTTPNTWFQILLIEDKEGTLKEGDALDPGTRPVFWPDFSEGNMFFDIWGGILKVGSDECDSSGNCSHEEDVITGGETVDGPEFYIGQNNQYLKPDPDKVDPVPAELLTQQFSVHGNILTNGLSNLKVILMSESYDPSTDLHLQKAVAVGKVTNDTYNIDMKIGDFFDSAGKPLEKFFMIIAVQDDKNEITAGSTIGNIPMWFPDFMDHAFGFDNMRGGKLVIVKDDKQDDGTWNHEEYDPSSTTDVTGPELKAENFNTTPIP